MTLKKLYTDRKRTKIDKISDEIEIKLKCELGHRKVLYEFFA